MDAMESDNVVSELLNMSLDDIAAKRREKGNKAAGGGGRGAGRGAARGAGKPAHAQLTKGAGGGAGRAATSGGGRGAGGGRSGGARASNGAVAAQQARPAVAGQGGGAARQGGGGAARQGGGGGGGGSGPVRRGAAVGRQARTAAAPYTREAPATRKPPIFQRLGAKAVQGHKVAVSNLNFDVMQVDLEELFAGMGKVLDLKMKYDRSGRSLGEAVVTFEQRAEAIKAVQELHTRTLDGTPMHLRILDGAAEANGAGGGGGGGGGGRNRSYSDPGEDRPWPRKQASAGAPGGGSNVREGVFGTAMADLANNSNSNAPRGRGASDVRFKVTLDGNRKAAVDRRGGGGGGGERGINAGRSRPSGGFGGHIGGGFGSGRGQGRGSRARQQQQHSTEDLDADLADWKGN